MLQVAHSACAATPVACCPPPASAAGFVVERLRRGCQRAAARWTGFIAARRERAHQRAVQRTMAGLDARTLRDIGLGDGLRSWQEPSWMGWERGRQ